MTARVTSIGMRDGSIRVGLRLAGLGRVVSGQLRGDEGRTQVFLLLPVAQAPHAVIQPRRACAAGSHRTFRSNANTHAHCLSTGGGATLTVRKNVTYRLCTGNCCSSARGQPESAKTKRKEKKTATVTGTARFPRRASNSADQG